MNTKKTDQRLTQPNRIVVALYAPKNDGLGTYAFERAVTPNELNTQIVNNLKAIALSGRLHPLNAYDAAESFCDYFDQRHPQQNSVTYLQNAVGRIFAIVSPGRCEGTILRIVYLKDDGTYASLLHIKYLIDEDHVWDLARKLSRQLEAGREV